MKNISEKLHKLKNNEKYKRINITEDLTNLKRNTVKSRINLWLALAEEKNDKNDNKPQKTPKLLYIVKSRLLN